MPDYMSSIIYGYLVKNFEPIISTYLNMLRQLRCNYPYKLSKTIDLLKHRQAQADSIVRRFRKLLV